MSYDLAPYGSSQSEALLQDRFNALAQVAGGAIAHTIGPKAIPGIALAAGAIGGALEGRWEGKGQFASAVLAAAAWTAALMAGDNADLRHGAVGMASGLGASAMSLLVYNKMISRTAATTAPAPTATTTTVA